MFESGLLQVSLLAFFGMGPMELLIVGVVAVLLFGSRLPEVARSLGKSFVEFKKGIQGIESDLNDAIYSPTPTEVSHYEGDPEEEEPAAPMFEPPSSEPQLEGESPGDQGDGCATDIGRTDAP